MENIRFKRVFSPLFHYYDEGIAYHGSTLFKAEVKVPFDTMGDYELISGHPQSLAVKYLAFKSLHCPNRVYQLAGFINSSYPEIDWDWDKQLLDFEKEIRLFNFQDAYFEETGLNFRSSFVTDSQFDLWCIEFSAYLKGCEPDSVLEERCKEKMAVWFKN